MEISKIFSLLPEALLAWYEENKRDLPWRKDRDPYHVWLSEIMLQQTRVEAVKSYYERFLIVLPSVSALAKADDDLLHKLWEGLGYYSRVRNLKKAAQQIIQQYNGVFPGKYEDVLALPGIGEYTAGAICSIAFGQPTPAVDGNVLRVVSRLTDDATPIDLPAYKKNIQTKLREVYPKDASGFTQALMELGATLCGPNRKPDCASCPCNAFCLAHRHGTAEQLPVKLPKRNRRVEEKTVFILRCDDRYALEKRPGNGLLAGMWQFPNVPGVLSAEEAVCWISDHGLKPKYLRLQLERKHIFTHIQWDMRCYFVDVGRDGEGFTWLTAEQVRKDAALPTAFRQFWEEINIPLSV